MFLRFEYLMKAISWNYAASVCKYDHDVVVCKAFAKKYWKLFLKGKNEVRSRRKNLLDTRRTRSYNKSVR